MAFPQVRCSVLMMYRASKKTMRSWRQISDLLRIVQGGRWAPSASIDRHPRSRSARSASGGCHYRERINGGFPATTQVVVASVCNRGVGMADPAIGMASTKVPGHRLPPGWLRGA